MNHNFACTQMTHLRRHRRCE